MLDAGCWILLKSLPIKELMVERELFYVLPEDVFDDTLRLQRQEVHHLVKVHRKKKGDFFIAVDGRGTGYDCEIESLDKNNLTAKILKKYRFYGESLFKLTLALAISKKSRFEWVIEKATEVGVTGIIPLLTKRTARNEQNLQAQRCERIALAAMKQSCRSFLPTITPVKNFASLCENSSNFDIKLIAHEKETGNNLNDIFQLKENVLQRIKSGIVCIGPEGGFTNEEIELANSSGFTTFGLGPRRLRTETAALVSASLILNRMGELQ
ncbi:MAG: 16S rRNA (uracil(1498)-N(3))-methyltransferase [Caldithrix sp.]|nr:MAG: 16S rRNA (uracil(1498)-N(3))-methyltransferase [Caldithrix sp.]